MMRAIRLKTEHLQNPIGVDFTAPRLFWNCEGGTRQTAYQITAESDSDTTIWDSGKVASRSMCALWGGKPVPPKTKVLWKVRLWDETNVAGQWAEAFFETGIDTWSAKWITGNYKVNKKQRYPVDCFHKTFNVSGCKKARLYITACGLYEARLNGQRIGEFILAPGITDYRKRVQYQTYDVTELLQSGENTLTVQLADGWYRGSTGAWGIRNQYGTETKLLAQLEITHADGSVQTIITDENWDWSNDGSIRFADNKDGEIVDAQKKPTYSGTAKITSHPITPTASNNVSVKEHEHLTAKKITTPSGKTVLDFGQNIAGYAAFTVNAHAGQTIKLRFGELLDENSEFTQKNIQLSRKDFVTPRQEIVYTCTEGENRYKTTFAIFGFPILFTNIYGLALLIPSIAFCVRRLHDTGKSGWYYLLGLIPFVGPIILLVLLCQSGEEQTGRAYAVTKDYVMFAVIGVASLLFMIIGFATMSSKMNEMKKLFGGSNPYTSIAEDTTMVDDDENLAWGDEDTESEASDVVSDEEGKDFITMFYQYYWGEKEYDKGNRESGDDALIDDFCTAKMQQKARDEYEYDYEGPESEKPYAVWIFRSGAQDGLGDSRLVNVESSGDGTFIANILDMGHEAKLKMNLVKENGEIKIDDVELLSVVEHW